MDAREQTKLHISMVKMFLDRICMDLAIRGKDHDASKLESPEVEMFDKFTKKLKGSTYGSDEYKGFLKEMGPALKHHYDNNRHHPEHHKDGVDGMNIIDVVEMLCDWKAATMRHADGDILKSIDINTKRFNLSPQLTAIFRNTVRDLGWANESETQS